MRISSVPADLPLLIQLANGSQIRRIRLSGGYYSASDRSQYAARSEKLQFDE